jgi:hypothetical protein
VYSDTLTRDNSVKIAREWIEANIEQPSSNRGRNQVRWLMEQMGALCIAECLKNNENEDRLYERLSKAHEILMSVWYATAPEIATRWWRDGKKPDENQQKAIDRAKATVWKRRDPQRSFVEGFESENYTAFDPDDFHGTIAQYLKEPWLRHPVIDWIMLDMMVSRELSAFGEELKQKFLPGPRANFGSIYTRYFEAKGNLEKLKKPDWNRIGAKFLLVIAVPIGAIYTAFHFGYQSVGLTISGLYAGVIALWLAVKVLRFIVTVGYAVTGKTHPRAKPFVLWEQMYEVWKLLKGPTVNPTLVREMMVKARDQGAVWDVPVWSIIDRVIQYDPAVWIVEGGSFS